MYLELGSQRRYAAVGKKVGAVLRTVKLWAADFDWRGRIKTYVAQRADQFVATETAVQREELLDATQRAQAFRERQYDVAEALLLAAERYLERLDEDALDQLNFADACKALDVASRLGRSATARETGLDSVAPQPRRLSRFVAGRDVLAAKVMALPSPPNTALSV